MALGQHARIEASNGLAHDIEKDMPVCIIEKDAFTMIPASFSPSWTAFQADRGRCFSVIVDDEAARK
jgi:hypothetical protein